MPAPLTCRRCRTPVTPEHFSGPDLLPCPGCDAPMRVTVFPAREHPAMIPRVPQTVVGDEAGCFYHADYQATASCDACGRFLCALCDLPLGASHYCAPCLEDGRRRRTLPIMETGATRWDALVFLLAVLPMLVLPFFYFSLVTAPLALFIGFFFWGRPGGVVPRHRTLMILGLTLSLIQLGLWAAGIFWLIYQAVTA